MRKTIASLAVAVAVAGGVAACSNNSDTTTDDDNTPPSAAAAGTPAASTSSEGVSLTDALKAAGAQCHDQSDGRPVEKDCTLNGVSFRLSTNGWKSEQSLRRQACDEGYVNSAFRVVTDGNAVITAEENDDNQTIIDALEKHGATVREESYCS